ncbi:MAG TPA: YceI family protein [Acidimicrobiia bacterium]|jgi:polyisoprenoid-binding protein YceI
MAYTITKPATGVWTFDPAHTSIGFTVKHLMAAKVRGSFKSFSGTISQGDAAPSTSVTVSIDPSSIDTGAEDRDNHLRSADFFDIETYPQVTFESTSITEKSGEFEVIGDLTIKDITKPVTVAMTYGGLISDPWGNEKAIFSGETKINREDFGLTWNQALEAGGWLVGKDVSIEVEVQAAKA